MKQRQHTSNAPDVAQWGVHWKSPTLMIVCFSLAVFLALGHHLMYSYLDGKPAENQEWILRAGTAFAVLSKICLTVVVGVAFAQRTWRILASRFMTMGAVDALFGVNSNPLNLFSAELFTNAKMALIMSLLVWASPLMIILAPGSLSVAVRDQVGTATIPIQNVNFSRGRSDLTATEALAAVNFVETTRVKQFDMSPDIGSPGYERPSSRATALIYQAVYGGQIVNSQSPCGANCSFSMSFSGPSYQCIEMDQYDPQSPWCALDTRYNCQDIVEDFGLTDPSKVTWYQARNSSSSFCMTRLENSTVCQQSSNEDDSWLDGTLWVRHRYLPVQHRAGYNSSDGLSNPKLPGSAWENTTFLCTQWETQFDIQRTFIEFQQEIRYNKRFLHPIRYGAVTSGYQYTDDYVGNPSQWASYAFHETLYSILKGVIGIDPRGLPANNALLDGTKLVESTPFPPQDGIRHPLRNLRELIEELSVNATLSIFSLDGLVYAQPQPDTLVTQTTNIPLWTYNLRAMLLVYGIALALALIILGIGTLDFVRNGVSFAPGFCTIVAMTRNPQLDAAARGACLGAEPIPETLGITRVRFGEIVSRPQSQSEKQGHCSVTAVESEDGVRRERRVNNEGLAYRAPRHAAFGLEGEVVSIEKSGYYS